MFTVICLIYTEAHVIQKIVASTEHAGLLASDTAFMDIRIPRNSQPQLFPKLVLGTHSELGELKDTLGSRN